MFGDEHAVPGTRLRRPAAPTPRGRTRRRSAAGGSRRTVRCGPNGRGGGQAVRPSVSDGGGHRRRLLRDGCDTSRSTRRSGPMQALWRGSSERRCRNAVRSTTSASSRWISLAQASGCEEPAAAAMRSSESVDRSACVPQSRSRSYVAAREVRSRARRPTRRGGDLGARLPCPVRRRIGRIPRRVAVLHAVGVPDHHPLARRTRVRPGPFRYGGSTGAALDGCCLRPTCVCSSSCWRPAGGRPANNGACRATSSPRWPTSRTGASPSRPPATRTCSSATRAPSPTSGRWRSRSRSTSCCPWWCTSRSGEVLVHWP